MTPSKWKPVFLTSVDPDEADRVRRYYNSDPTYRARKITLQKKWNKKNHARKAISDARWAKINGAAAAKRYRERKKKMKNA